MDGDWRDDWYEVDGVLYPRGVPRQMSLAQREQQWVKDNWDRLRRIAERVEDATKCFICKQVIKGIAHDYQFNGVTVKECDECRHWHAPPPNPHGEPLSEKRYHGGYGSHTQGRFRKSDDA